MSPIRVLCIFPDNSTTDIYVTEIGEFLRLTNLVAKEPYNSRGSRAVFIGKFPDRNFPPLT